MEVRYIENPRRVGEIDFEWPGRHREKTSEHAGYTDHRPWGRYTILSAEADHKVKRLVVDAGHRLSLQRHTKRAEHWFVLRGRAMAFIDGAELTLSPGQAVNIPRMAWHRVGNAGPEDLMFIEVQTGTYFGEDDIERIEDDYGRIQRVLPLLNSTII